jgi:hypothetical protein
MDCLYVCLYVREVFGVCLVLKLCAILLMEEDFNTMNKEEYGTRMLEEARKYKLEPEEKFSKKNRMANNRGLAKTLFYNIVRQLRVPSAIALVDASNCYDCIAHAMALLIFQSFGVEDMAVTAMLKTKQDMIFFLRTAYEGIFWLNHQSEDTRTGPRELPSPAGWCIISIMILWVHGAKGHKAHSLHQCLMCKAVCQQSCTWMTLIYCT